jgi:hypothetical protein
MPFNINNFKANIRDYGYLDNNSFAVLVQTPPILFGSNISNQGTEVGAKNIAEKMSFRIDQVRAPGISIMSAPINRYGIGPVQSQPTTAQYSELSFSVLSDHYCEIWQFWHTWARAVFEFNGVSQGSSPSYTANYKDRYSSVVQIQIMDHFGNIIQKINTFQTFPTAIRDIPLAWGDSNLMKINISMAYTEYTLEGVETKPQVRPQPNNLQNRGLVQRENIPA